MGGHVGGWDAGADGRQTCGAEVVIVVLMVFQEGGGLVWGLFIALVSLMTPQRDYSGYSTQLHKTPLRSVC